MEVRFITAVTRGLFLPRERKIEPLAPRVLTTLKSLISSLNSVIPESDRISPSYSGSAFGRFVVDFLYFIVLLID